MDQREFYVKRLLHDIRDFGSELRSLEKRGFVSKDQAIPGGRRVRPSALLWWLSDELARTVRDEPSLKEWLQAQEWEGLLTHDEREQLKKVVRTATDMLKDGVAELIKAAAKGAVGG